MPVSSSSGASLPCNQVILQKYSVADDPKVCMEERSVHCKCVCRNPGRHCSGYWKIWRKRPLICITLLYFTTPLTTKVTSINKVIFVIHWRAQTCEFSVVFWKYQSSLVLGDWKEVSSRPSVQRTRNLANQTWASVLGFRRVRIVKNKLGGSATQQELRVWGVGGHNGKNRGTRGGG